MAFVSNLGIAFEETVCRHESRTALIYPGSGVRVTYGELNLLVGRIASVLWQKGLRQGSVAALFHDKSPAAYATMLACLRLGIIYTNLDPDSPWERLRKILGTCQPNVIVNAFQKMPFEDELALEGYPNTLNLQHLDLKAPEESFHEYCLIGGGTPAYIMFTSGSTGTPKGAVMSHANLLWFIAWARDRFAITPDDVLTNVNPIYFDNSVFDFYSAIFSGAALVPFTSDQVSDTRLLVRLVGLAKCSIWFSVPSLLVYLLTTRALTASDFPAIRSIVFGGEGFPKSKLKQLFDLFGDRSSLENVYGPTECTCICSAHRVTEADFEDMQSLAPLGLLAPNFESEILPLDTADPDFGELFLRGPQVGLGYFNDSERTCKVFEQNPQHSRFIDIGYHTGDLIRKDRNGWMHFKGRADFQIKHMGYRIELEEIEAAVNSLFGVMECAVIYQKLDDSLGQILAFVVMSSLTSPEELQRQVAEFVPVYMVPRRVVVLDLLPKNQNGKIDRVALQQSINPSKKE